MPFMWEEVIRILAALEAYGKSAGIRNAQRLRAFIVLLRYSGLRIGDAVQIDTNRIRGNKLLLHTEKTGVPVYCVLPDMVIRHRIPRPILARDISFGRERQLCAAPRESGRNGFSASLNWPTCQMVTHTDSGILLPWSCSSVVFRLTGSRSYLATAALGSRSAITHHGRARDRIE
jgi:hypothetical protein